jgi:hypothetical protein
VTADAGAADHVRREFSKLPFDSKISTLIRIELDILGDAVDAVVSTASRAIDEVANACSKSSASTTSNRS